ncbi:MAG: carbon starvation protein A [Verrucomicrobiota bacterium]|nr:carbon starvation protein A [Verrucomicrobiota bacterium]
MQPFFVALLAGLGFVVAYHTYGRWLGRRIFELSAKTVCPSLALEDGVDYVPTSKGVVFGHHFTSIAGTGPIVGPAIAVMWGWVPALLWVVLGSIFIGAVHDFGALVVSLRHRGQTVGDIAGKVMNRRVRLLFLFILFMALTIVLAIFGLVIASVFKMYPAAIFPCLIQIPLATLIGFWLNRKGVNLLLPSLISLVIMYGTVLYGNEGWLGTLNASMQSWNLITWVIFLLAYSYVASVLPVWTLLQPRDYINSLQLISALALIVLGLMGAAFLGGASAPGGVERAPLEWVAPAFQWHPEGAPFIFPFLFITIACGAISGFHCLVSSGTSSKQLKSEPDARFVGYGSMLTEGFLATLVIVACAAGLGLGLEVQGQWVSGVEAWEARYATWGAAGSLGAKVAAFVDGAANLLRSIGLAAPVALALMAVLVASFAGTTLDTACRLQRYVIQELASTVSTSSFSMPWSWLTNRHGATLFGILIAAVVAAAPAPGQADWSLATSGKGGLILWPLFGATNQLLAGLAFLVITFHRWRRNKPVWFLILPALFMLVMPMWAMLLQLFFGNGSGKSWLASGHWLLVGVGITTIALEVWMLIEALIMFPKVKGVLEHSSDSVVPQAATESS